MSLSLNCSVEELNEYLKNLKEGYVPCRNSELSICFPAGEEDCYPTCSLDTSQSEQSRSILIASKSYQYGKKTVSFPGFQSLMIYAHSMERSGRDSSTLSPAGSLSFARTLAVREKGKVSKERDPDFGEKWQESSVRYDPATSSWKTHRSLWEEDLPESSVILPKEGMMQDGCVYQRRTSERPIEGTGFGWLPTPSACSYGSNQGGAAGRTGKVRHSLESMARKDLFPTPSVSSSKQGQNEPDGRRGQTLIGAARGQRWPTPTVQDSNGRTHHNQRDGSKTLSLLGQVEANPIMTCDCGHIFELVSLSEPCPSCKQIRGGSVTYPTPTSSMMTVGDMEQARFAGNDPRRPDYEEANRIWPTPKSSPSGPDFARANREGSGGDDLATSVAREQTTGQLNPSWVEILMSWPKGWSSLEPLKHIDEDWFEWPEDWERDTPRTTINQPNRVQRLKAIGNGQVPICAATAWRILAGM
jgi:hypothetical protein